MGSNPPRPDGEKFNEGKKRQSPVFFNQKQYEAHKSAIAVLMGHFMLRHLNRLYHAFEGDLLLPIVLGEIAHHNIFKFYSRSSNCLDFREKLRTDGELAKHLACTNAFSISEATGIPRETVRRKIDKLVKKGWLIKSTRGEVTISETVGEHFMKDFNKVALSELLETSECIKKLFDPQSKSLQNGGSP